MTARIPNAELEPGIEIALAWIEQGTRHSDRTSALSAIADSVLHMMDAELIWALDSADRGATVWFTNAGLSDEAVPGACGEDGLFTWLTGIRFAHVFNRSSEELKRWFPEADSPVQSMVAVPLLRGERSGECLVAANRRNKKVFGQPEVTLLSLAAAVLDCLEN